MGTINMVNLKNFLCVTLLLITSTVTANDSTTKELDVFWQQLSETVTNGDFEQYSAGYHEDAILVSGFSKNSYSIKQALARWKQGFDDTKNGKMKASVKFVWTKRFVSDNTAHETGMFKYSTTDDEGVTEDFIAHLTTLSVKKNGKWLIMMENQKSKATQQEWDAAQ